MAGRGKSGLTSQTSCPLSRVAAYLELTVNINNLSQLL